MLLRRRCCWLLGSRRAGSLWFRGGPFLWHLRFLCRWSSVIHDDFLWGCLSAGGLKGSPKLPDLGFLGVGEFIHAIRECTPRTVKTFHIPAQRLEIIFAANRARQFHGGAHHVIQSIEIAIQLESQWAAFGGIL